MITLSERKFEVEVEREENFRFVVDFGVDGVDLLVTDEAPPLGEGEGPNPARLLAAAVGNCLAASLLYCLRKGGAEPEGILATVTGTLKRTARGRLRIGQLDVVLTVDGLPGSKIALERCLDRFEDFCMVTESVRQGIDVMVEVRPRVPAPASDGRQEPAPAG